MNTGWVSVEMDHDTSRGRGGDATALVAEDVRCGRSGAERLLVTFDGGGSNSSRSWLWKVEEQALADELDMWISVCLSPPGTSKPNRIERRKFATARRTGDCGS